MERAERRSDWFRVGVTGNGILDRVIANTVVPSILRAERTLEPMVLAPNVAVVSEIASLV